VPTDRLDQVYDLVVEVRSDFRAFCARLEERCPEHLRRLNEHDGEIAELRKRKVNGGVDARLLIGVIVAFLAGIGALIKEALGR
jgi:hypothetical protein